MPTYFTNDASTQNTVSYAYTTGYANNPITSNVLINVLTPYDTVALRNTALSNYLTITTASNTYATITNLNAKQNTLTSNTNLLGIGSSITGLNYNNISNAPSLTGYATTAQLVNKQGIYTIERRYPSKSYETLISESTVTF